MFPAPPHCAASRPPGFSAACRRANRRSWSSIQWKVAVERIASTGSSSSSSTRSAANASIPRAARLLDHRRAAVDGDHRAVRDPPASSGDPAGAAAGVEHPLVPAEVEPVDDVARHRELAKVRDVIDRLDLQGDERVLDASCGQRSRHRECSRHARARWSRSTAARRWWSGPAIDGGSTPSSATWSSSSSTSPSTRWVSTATFPTGSRTTSACSDACTPRSKPGGRLAAQCGGAGNIANVQAAINAVDEPTFPRPGPARGTTRRPSRPRSGCAPWASPTSERGCSRGRSSPQTPTSTSRP